MAPRTRNRKVNAFELNEVVNETLAALFAAFDIMFEEEIENENRIKSIKTDINSYFDALTKTALELRQDNNSLNDAEIVSGRYKKDILEIIEKYFPDKPLHV